MLRRRKLAHVPETPLRSHQPHRTCSIIPTSQSNKKTRINTGGAFPCECQVLHHEYEAIQTLKNFSSDTNCNIRQTSILYKPQLCHYKDGAKRKTQPVCNYVRQICFQRPELSIQQEDIKEDLRRHRDEITPTFHELNRQYDR